MPENSKIERILVLYVLNELISTSRRHWTLWIEDRSGGFLLRCGILAVFLVLLSRLGKLISFLPSIVQSATWLCFIAIFSILISIR